MSHPHRAQIRALFSMAFAGAAMLAPARAASQQQQPSKQSDCARDSTQRAPQDSTRHVGHQPNVLPCVRVVAASPKRADAATTEVILPSAIRTVPASDAWDIMRQAASVQVHLQGQGPGFASDAAFRGFTSDHSTDVAMGIDGVPVNEPVNGHAEGYSDWNAIMPEAISSVEVTMGPAVPWAGNFAMGGVVDVKTRAVAVGTQWSARLGSYGDARLTLLNGDANESGGYMAAFDYQRSDGWRNNSNEYIAHTLVNRTWQGANEQTISLGVSAYGGQWRSPGYLDTTQYNAGQLTGAANPTDGGNEMFGSVRGSLSRPGWGGTITSNLYAQDSWWNIFLTIPPEGGIGEGSQSQTQETDQRFGFGGDTRWSKPMGSTHLVVGLEYRVVSSLYSRYYTTDRARDSIFFFDSATPANLNATYVSVAPVVEAHWDATEKLSFGIGGRLDWLYYAMRERTGGPGTSDGRWIATPKLSADYRFTNELAAYASFNGGFRSSDGVIADPTLAPTLENQSEIGVRYSGQRAEGSVGVFLINVRDQQTVDPITLQLTSGGTSRQQGVDLDGRIALGPWLALFAHATINDAHYVTLTTEEGENLAGVPVYQVAKTTVDGGFDVAFDGVAGSIWAAYTGPWTPVNEPDVRTSPYALLNLRATVPFGGAWSGALGVQNILDQKYVEVQASGFVNPGTPRQFLFTIRHGF